MTKEQIEIYEYCKKDIEQLKLWKDKLPFKNQNHGCGSQVPKIEHELEGVHREMFDSVSKAIDHAIDKIEEKIKNI